MYNSLQSHIVQSTKSFTCYKTVPYHFRLNHPNTHFLHFPVPFSFFSSCPTSEVVPPAPSQLLVASVHGVFAIPTREFVVSNTE